jgi:hypothetical protein
VTLSQEQEPFSTSQKEPLAIVKAKPLSWQSFAHKVKSFLVKLSPIFLTLFQLSPGSQSSGLLSNILGTIKRASPLK